MEGAENTETGSPPHCERFFYACSSFDGQGAPIRKAGGSSRFEFSHPARPAENGARSLENEENHRMKLFLIALWAFLKAHPDASFDEFQMAADRAAKLARWPG